ncbi:MAG: ABC transporter substrate-binding protein [Micrococcales bacterium]|nr:ABC transporter substrate-binding protein [Micrococcales bacterium]
MTTSTPTRRTTRAVTLSLTLAGALALAACGGGSDPMASETSSSAAGSASASSSGSGGGGPVVVGSADFSESELLAEIYAGALKAKGVNASTKLGIGSREIYLKALEDGSITLVPEYTGALALYYDDGFTGTDPDTVYDAALSMAQSKGLTLLKRSAAEDNDSLVVTKETASKNSLTNLSSLKGKADKLTLAAPPEFKTRPQGVPGLEKTYEASFKSFRPLKGQALVQALKNGQVDVANIFSTDPSIAANGFVTLEDDKKLFGSQNVVPLVKQGALNAEGEAALDAVSKALTTDKLSALLKQVDVDKKDPSAVAKSFLGEAGLG